jgi:hypothetical protein
VVLGSKMKVLRFSDIQKVSIYSILGIVPEVREGRKMNTVSLWNL